MSSLNGKGPSLTIGGTVRPIKFTIDALSQIEDKYGSLDNFDVASSNKPASTIRYVLHILWDMSEAAAGEVIDEAKLSLNELMKVIRTSFRLALGVPESSSLQKLVTLAAAVEEAFKDPELMALIPEEQTVGLKDSVETMTKAAKGLIPKDQALKAVPTPSQN